MIEPLFKGSVNRPTDSKRIKNQIANHTVRVGPDAAREIALRIEDRHGFWDFDDRRRAASEIEA